MRLMRKSLLLIASSVLAVAATGVLSAATGVLSARPASAAPASAATYYETWMCVDNSAVTELDCAWANGVGQPVGMYPETANTTNWAQPGSTWGEIWQAGTNRCMQLNHNAGNEIQEETCTGATAQEFKSYYYSSNTYVYISKYAPTTYLCLAYNESHQILDMVTCPYHNGAFAPAYAPWYERIEDL
jgi:hypothetical protein